MSDLRDDLEPGDADELGPLGERLLASRPLPAPAFRGNLRRHLAARRATAPTRPKRMWVLVASSAGSGTLLLLVAALGVAGSGPLA